MNILVFNCGSSSLNYKVYQKRSKQPLSILARGKAHRVGVKGSEPSFIEHHFQAINEKNLVEIPTHQVAASLVLDFLFKNAVQVDSIGHRFVHGGSSFHSSALINPENLARLTSCLPLAPIHNPNSMSVIKECQTRMAGIPQYVTFDTAFHSTLPEKATTYPLPKPLIDRYGFRKFGFHGLSYQVVTQRAASFLNRPLDELKIIACHLGTGGSSVVAVDRGKSIETSMGYTPLAGLMMSTRTGDLDPLIPVYLMENWGKTPEELNDLFNKKSGLLGVSGFSSDIRDLLKARDVDHNPRAALALEMYTQRLQQTIGAYALLLDGMDALLFTDDIGVQNPEVRQAACQGLEWAGVQLDPNLNQSAAPDQITAISSSESKVTVLSVPTDEELVIAMEGIKLFGGETNDHSGSK